jgi:hypothetical protein
MGIDQMIERPSREPKYCNFAMVLGVESISEHLRKRHGLSAQYIAGLSVDERYRVHDAIHEAKGDE